MLQTANRSVYWKDSSGNEWSASEWGSTEPHIYQLNLKLVGTDQLVDVKCPTEVIKQLLKDAKGKTPYIPTDKSIFGEKAWDLTPPKARNDGKE